MQDDWPAQQLFTWLTYWPKIKSHKGYCEAAQGRYVEVLGHCKVAVRTYCKVAVRTYWNPIVVSWVSPPSTFSPQTSKATMTTSNTSTSSRRRLLIVAGLSLASGVAAASAATDLESPLHRPPALPSCRRHYSSSAPRNCVNHRHHSNTDRHHQQHSRLLLSKALFFSGQPVLSFIAAQSRHGGNRRSSPSTP
jgi:hypothetical protein